MGGWGSPSNVYSLGFSSEDIPWIMGWFAGDICPFLEDSREWSSCQGPSHPLTMIIVNGTRGGTEH